MFEVGHMAINADDVEATITVADVAACVDRAEAAGGQVLMSPTEIPGVGTVAFVADPGGNPIGFMQHG